MFLWLVRAYAWPQTSCTRSRGRKYESNCSSSSPNATPPPLTLCQHEHGHSYKHLPHTSCIPSSRCIPFYYPWLLFCFYGLIKSGYLGSRTSAWTHFVDSTCL